MGTLGMIGNQAEVTKSALTVGYAAQLEQREIALHALGGLLVGGKWNTAMLQSLRGNSRPDSIEHELYSMLLGTPYGPGLRQKLSDERKARADERQRFEKNIRELTEAKQQAEDDMKKGEEKFERDKRQMDKEREDEKGKLEGKIRRLEREGNEKDTAIRNFRDILRQHGINIPNM
jgi:hypothetical protein